MFGVQIADDWLSALYDRATESDAKKKPDPLPIWLPDIEKAIKSGKIRNPYDEAIKLARGE